MVKTKIVAGLLAFVVVASLAVNVYQWNTNHRPNTGAMTKQEIATLLIHTQAAINFELRNSTAPFSLLAKGLAPLD